MAGNTESKITPQRFSRMNKKPIQIRIKPVHTSVAGRARFNVNILYRAAALGRQFERQLNAIPGVTSVRVNSWTGSVVVLFDNDVAQNKLPYILLEACKRAIANLRYTGSFSTSEATTVTKAATETLTDLSAYFSSWGKRIQSLLAPSSHPTASASVSQDNADWHTLKANQILKKFQVNARQGLDKQTAHRMLEQYGLNQLPAITGHSPLSMLLEQVLTLPVGLLTVSAIVSAATGGLLDAAIIVGVVLINTAIGFFTEMQAEKIISSLTKITPPVCAGYPRG